jgi:hypothetical protein
MRKAKKFSFLILAQGLAFMLLAGYSFYRVEADRSRVELKRQMVKDWEFTDLCLFTEASYTRHPSQTDRHTPFQNSPLTFEHFPSGSILLPPEALKK